MSRAEVKLDLSRIVFIGRTFDEYMLMFGLSKEELRGRKILDCPAGACSFTAIANQLGADVTATDIAYYHPFEQLTEKGSEDIEHAMLSMEKAQSNYKWDYFKSVEGLRSHRIQALNDCANDMKEFPNRYVPAVLPMLPFGDEEFDLTLSAHFLFMYADRLDYDLHLQAIQELMRVTKEEIRIFPLVDLSCNRYEHLDKLIDFIQSQGYIAEEIKVGYEFQKGANSMLRIKKV
ncbi:SAM-dependent methyltransferase [Bacillus sp. FJAT-27264]|uniref:class I SAM-dependent methyltransferase n=1 Tax=Paenibacillus sp. (strain DSM 101736 / FJAT-27264) TaxID=1850362 RepID=UPI0008081152|nr:class I SAM-dependent methyltransferase [Bacillus sp. FJAT-27264]OBZ09037.1 SAM-dependent methyltransferase [Bacillus sp. FJAT-27264]